jgi:hypothetical protein
MIRQLARYEVRPGSIQKCAAAIRVFVDHVRANEPGTAPLRLVAGARPPEKEFSRILYPECLEPVEFVEYELVATNR